MVEGGQEEKEEEEEIQKVALMRGLVVEVGGQVDEERPRGDWW